MAQQSGPKRWFQMSYFLATPALGLERGQPKPIQGTIKIEANEYPIVGREAMAITWTINGKRFDVFAWTSSQGGEDEARFSCSEREVSRIAYGA